MRRGKYVLCVFSMISYKRYDTIKQDVIFLLGKTDLKQRFAFEDKGYERFCIRSLC